MIISPDFKQIALVGGEPIFFTFQPARADKTPEPNLATRKMVFMIYSKTDGYQKVYPGQYRAATQRYEWNIHGKVSKELEGRTDVQFFIGAIVNDGIAPVTNNGSLVIEEGPPYNFDDDDAAYAETIWHVVRANDPLDKYTSPKYFIDIVDYDGSGIVTPPVEPPVSGYSPFDFSLTDDTMLAFAAM